MSWIILGKVLLLILMARTTEIFLKTKQCCRYTGFKREKECGQGRNLRRRKPEGVKLNLWCNVKQATGIFKWERNYIWDNESTLPRLASRSNVLYGSFSRTSVIIRSPLNTMSNNLNCILSVTWDVNFITLKQRTENYADT